MFKCEGNVDGDQVQLTLLYQQLLDMEMRIHYNVQNSLLQKLSREKKKLAEKFDAHNLAHFKQRLVKAGYEGLVERYLGGMNIADGSLEEELRILSDILKRERGSDEDTSSAVSQVEIDEDNSFHASMCDGARLAAQTGDATPCLEGIAVSKHSDFCAGEISTEVAWEMLQRDEDHLQLAMDMLEKLALQDCSSESRIRSSSSSSSPMDPRSVASFGECAFLNNSYKDAKKVELAKIETSQEQLFEARQRALTDLDAFLDMMQVLKQIVFTNVQLVQSRQEFEKVQADIDKEIDAILEDASRSLEEEQESLGKDSEGSVDGQKKDTSPNQGHIDGALASASGSDASIEVLQNTHYGDSIAPGWFGMTQLSGWITAFRSSADAGSSNVESAKLPHELLLADEASGASGTVSGSSVGAAEDGEVSEAMRPAEPPAATARSSSSASSSTAFMESSVSLDHAPTPQAKKQQRPRHLQTIQAQQRPKVKAAELAPRNSGAGLSCVPGEDATDESWSLVAAFDRNQSIMSTAASFSVIFLSTILHYLRCSAHGAALASISGSHCVTDCAIHAVPIPYDESLKPCLLRLNHVCHQDMLKAGVDHAKEQSESLCRLVVESGAGAMLIYGGLKVGCYLGDTVWSGLKIGSRELKKLAISSGLGGAGNSGGILAIADGSTESSEEEREDAKLEPDSPGSSAASSLEPGTIESLIRCPVCLETNPHKLCVWLPCGHSICESCGTDMIGRAGLQRPKCQHCRLPCKELKRIFLG